MTNFNYKGYDNVNKVPEIPVTKDMDPSDFPEFIIDVLEATCITSNAKQRFFEKFGFRYLKDKKFQSQTEGYSFLFLDKEYYGAYENSIIAFKIGKAITKTICVIDMHPIILGEYSERTISLGMIEKHEFKKSGTEKILEVYNYDYYKVAISIGEVTGDTKTKLIDDDNFICDTGCTTSHSPFSDYINLDYKYNNLPYDEDNEEINNEAYKLDRLLDLNKFLGSIYLITTESAGNVKYKKTLMLFDEGAFIIINTGLYIKLRASSCPRFKESVKFSLLDLFPGTKPKNIKRPLIGSPLLGLDILNQLNVKIEQIKPMVNVMTFSHPPIYQSDISGVRSYDELQIKYEVYVMSPGMVLFTSCIKQKSGEECKETEIEDLDLLHCAFVLSKSNLVTESNHNDFYLRVEFSKTLHLVNLLTTTKENEREIIALTKNNRDIDGYIINQHSQLKDVEIHLKRTDYKISQITPSDSEFNIKLVYNRLLKYRERSYLVDDQLNKL